MKEYPKSRFVPPITRGAYANRLTRAIRRTVVQTLPATVRGKCVGKVQLSVASPWGSERAPDRDPSGA